MSHKKKENKAVKCSACFKLLGIPSRMIIYNFLSDGKKATVSEIVSKLDLTQPTVSYHLKEMKKVGFLDNKRSGKKVYYFLDKSCPYSQESCTIYDVVSKKDKYKYIDRDKDEDKDKDKDKGKGKRKDINEGESVDTSGGDFDKNKRREK